MPSNQDATQAPLLGEPLPVELMNTIWADRDGIHDALSSPAEAKAWLTAIGYRFAEDLSVQAAEQLRELRDALRGLAAETTRDPRPIAAASSSNHRAAVETINAASARAHTWPELAWPVRGTPKANVLSSPTPAEVSVSKLANEAVTLFAGAQRDLLRACLAPGCVLYFVKSHPRREWCSASCGNRARVARHYQKHRGE